MTEFFAHFLQNDACTVTHAKLPVEENFKAVSLYLQTTYDLAVGKAAIRT
jgi:hypothetical protein